MDTTNSFDWGWIIFLILILWFFIGGNNGIFGRGNYPAYNAGFLTGEEIAQTNGANVGATHSEVERRQLITAAETNFRIIDQASQTRQLVEDMTAKTNAAIEANMVQDLRDKLSEAQRANMMLENKLYSDAKFNAIESQLAGIASKMAVKPEIYSTSAVCPNAAVINGLGINGSFPPYNPYLQSGNVLS